MFLHHGLSILTWPVGLSHPVCHWFLLTCLSMEASTPFVQLRWFLKQHTTKSGLLYLINGLVMTLAFFGKSKSREALSRSFSLIALFGLIHPLHHHTQHVGSSHYHIMSGASGSHQVIAHSINSCLQKLGQHAVSSFSQIC